MPIPGQSIGAALALFFGGLALIVLGAVMAGLAAMRMSRHVQLLNAYGIRTNDAGYPRVGPSAW